MYNLKTMNEDRPGGSRKGSEDQTNQKGDPQREQESNRDEETENAAQSNAALENTAVPSVLDVFQTNLTDLLSRLSIASTRNEGPPSKKVIDDLTLKGLLEHWKKNGFKKIVTMVGAGISTSAGIPDFRSPGSGIYDNLKKYNLPSPTDIFELDYFMDNPKPFFALAKELYPGSFVPTPAHFFIRLLNEKNLLVRHYTQNIDSLERIAGIPEEKLVEAHGTFHTNHCVECSKLYIKEWMKEKIFSDEMPVCDDCGGIVKPDIVFFGENLPQRFYDLPPNDFKDCDLLIIMGTSLEVFPFASLVDYVEPNCLRLFINRINVDRFKKSNNTRDITFIGDCDDGVWQIADALGWKDELKAIIDRETPTDLKKKGSKIDDEKRKRKSSKLQQQQQ